MLDKIEWRSGPSKEFPYWLFSPEGHGMMFFRTPEDRDGYAEWEISQCLDDGYWSEEVEQICGGVCTHLTEKFNERENPEEPTDTSCEYRFALIPSEPFVQE
jgi:hypothetical protein